MSITYDGAYKVANNNKSANGKHRNTSRRSVFEEIKKNKGFRGFEKVPRVVVSRYNITPYLKKIKTSNLSKYKAVNKETNQCFEEGDQKEFHSVFITDPLRLIQPPRDCQVQVFRQNLEKLKESLISSPRSDISISDETMASIKCKICEKVYASEKKLLNHQENKHMLVYRPELKPQKRVSFSDHIIVHEVKEYHKCRKCTKIFEDYKSLKVHMKQKHKKRKCYICNYCNKNFVDRMFFKVHIKLHCDVCGLLLPNKSSHVDHKRNVCRTVKLHKCKTCDSSFFKFMDLKDHSYEHLSTFFICDICKDQFSTKCAVSHHIKFLHSKKRPTELYAMRNLGSERLYLCNFCEESSVDRDIIEAHVQSLPDLSNRAMTGYKDFYFCDQCLKKFVTEQDMLHHKWTHFLKTSDNSQVRPKSILTKGKIKDVKTKYNILEKIPDHFKPSLVLTRIDKDVNWKKNGVYMGMNNFEEIKRPRKTLISKHQCQVSIINFTR